MDITLINHRTPQQWIESAIMWVGKGKTYGNDMASSREACYESATNCIEYALAVEGQNLA